MTAPAAAPAWLTHAPAGPASAAGASSRRGNQAYHQTATCSRKLQINGHIDLSTHSGRAMPLPGHSNSNSSIHTCSLLFPAFCLQPFTLRYLYFCRGMWPGRRVGMGQQSGARSDMDPLHGYIHQVPLGQDPFPLIMLCCLLHHACHRHKSARTHPRPQANTHLLCGLWCHVIDGGVVASSAQTQTWQQGTGLHEGVQKSSTPGCRLLQCKHQTTSSLCPTPLHFFRRQTRTHTRMLTHPPSPQARPFSLDCPVSPYSITHAHGHITLAPERNTHRCWPPLWRCACPAAP